MVENAGLTEWPVPLLGRFDADFLDVPREVIVAHHAHQPEIFRHARMRPGRSHRPSSASPTSTPNDGGEAIVEGNERVLAARLSDARFFWEQDLKVPLEEQAKKLSGIVFHEKLGTVADKVERIANLARWLVEKGIVKRADPDQAERAARLAKADLVTGMVGEFPELQGVIGSYLARAQGEPEAIADAIRDHYKPVGQGDEAPTAPVTVAVALADKLDTLFAFFKERMFPTGSKDPFALRRAAIGAISLVLENDLKIHTDAPAEHWLDQSDPKKILTSEDRDARAILTTVPDFLLDRLQVQQKDKGVRHDLIQASSRWSGREDGRLDRIVQRAIALQGFVETPEGANLLAGYKRAANILKKESWDANAASTSAAEPNEQALVDALANSEPHAIEAVEQEDFTGAMAALSTLRAPIDVFFDKVTVNDPDGAVRARRLNLLARFRDAVHQVADFSKIEG